LHAQNHFTFSFFTNSKITKKRGEISNELPMTGYSDWSISTPAETNVEPFGPSLCLSERLIQKVK